MTPALDASTDTGARPTLVFAHANGFPAACYAKLFAALAADYDIRYLPRLGHDPAYPVSDGWPALVEELIRFIERGPQPVIAVGHSLGGLLCFMAAVERPELFSALVLLDAPIGDRLRNRTLQLCKRLGAIERLTPAHATRRRRQHWASEAEAVAHFRTRKLFRHFDVDCLADYVRFGTQATQLTPEGRRLYFEPQIEAQIYCTIPHRLHHLLPQLRVPGGFIGGRQSRERRLLAGRHMPRFLRMRPIDGSHLFPFERPLATATAIREMLHALQANTVHCTRSA